MHSLRQRIVRRKTRKYTGIRLSPKDQECSKKLYGEPENIFSRVSKNALNKGL